jgi:ADP-ribosylglycohydrolase
LSYALGGGRATKAAATSLSKSNTAWFSNNHADWLDAGGNGAAMRIQPHVWAARDLGDPVSYLVDVLRNSICTHGNVTALFGAAFHAAALAAAMGKHEVPQPEDAPSLVDIAWHASELLRGDAEIAEYWLPQWTHHTGRNIADAWRDAAKETSDACGVAIRVAKDAQAESAPSEAYRALLESLNLFDERRRGAGTLTAVVSLGLCWIEPRPDHAMVVAANAVGSDTDTIATMAGAILGATAPHAPEGPLLDSTAIQDSADLMTDVASGTARAGFAYPDLLTWIPPRTLSDTLVEGPHGLLVRGLGGVKETVTEPTAAPTGDAAWQWLQLAYGQTLLIKRRRIVPRLPDADNSVMNVKQNPSLRRVGAHRESRDQRPSTLDIDSILHWLEKEEYRESAIGYAVRRVIDEGSSNQLIALVTALRERRRHTSQPRLFD